MMPLGPPNNRWTITPRFKGGLSWEEFRKKYDEMEPTEENYREAQSDMRNFRLLDKYEASTSGLREHSKMIVENWIGAYERDLRAQKIKEEGTIEIPAKYLEEEPDEFAQALQWQKAEVVSRIPEDSVKGTASRFEQAREVMANNPNFKKPLHWKHWSQTRRLAWIENTPEMDRTLALQWLTDSIVP